MSEQRTKKINDFFMYKNNNLYVEDVSIINIANNIKTPFYVYSTASLRRRYIDLATKPKKYKTFIIFFSKIKFKSCSIESVIFIRFRNGCCIWR